MVIRYLGHASFLIKTKDGSLVVDPFDAGKVGLPFPKVSADIVLSTHDHFDHNHIEAVGGDPFVIQGPGEYEISGIKVWAYPAFHDTKGGKERGKNIIYLIESEGVTICHLGDLGHLLDEGTVEEINSPHIVLIPTGGVYTIDHEEAAKVAAQLESKVVIPMHFKVPGMSEEFKDLSEVSAFLEEMGVAGVEAEKELKVSASSLPEEPEVVVLKSG
jgi:L-ascorbate metabolism protein UlaG (beta-lactamase superfamily)